MSAVSTIHEERHQSAENGTAPSRTQLARHFDKLCSILDRFERDPSKLIPILQAVQAEYRYLPEQIMNYVATALGLPPARVYGVATFYSHFALEPRGKYVCRICDGTACHVKGSEGLLEELRRHLKLSASQTTTADMLFTVETVSCLGACGLAPVMTVNEDVHGQLDAEKALEVVKAIQEAESSTSDASTRSAQ
ncbi:MAG: NAD(P)H-dependent oxidoreductase subunit E [Myxococcota bacterium]|jgi:NADH-quinone oxidoreductase subunit E|nr:NAD(P)H-dependent oxidoreductase subunit E [Myxococcota bacterium]